MEAILFSVGFDSVLIQYCDDFSLPFYILAETFESHLTSNNIILYPRHSSSVCKIFLMVFCSMTPFCVDEVMVLMNVVLLLDRCHLTCSSAHYRMDSLDIVKNLIERTQGTLS